MPPPQTMTQAAAPTAEQFTALMTPPTEHPTATQLFDYQVACLVQHDLATLEMLESLRSVVPMDGKLFLVVPPKPQIVTKADLDILIARLSYRGCKGKNHLDPQYLKDEIAVPSNHYLMTDVEDGRAMLNTASRNAEVRLKEANRLPFTWFEGYCLYASFGHIILGHHNVGCSGSRYESKAVPRFYLGYLGDEQPKFNRFWDDNAGPERGFASCGSRVEA